MEKVGKREGKMSDSFETSHYKQGGCLHLYLHIGLRTYLSHTQQKGGRRRG